MFICIFGDSISHDCLGFLELPSHADYIAGEDNEWDLTSFVPVSKEAYASRPSLVPVSGEKYKPKAVPVGANLDDLVAAATFTTLVQGIPTEVLHVGRGIVIRAEEYRLLQELVRRLVEAKQEHRRRQELKARGGQKRKGRSEPEVSVEIPLYSLYSAVQRSFWPDAVQNVLLNPRGAGGGRTPEFNVLRESAAFCK